MSTLRRALDDERRWDDVLASLAALADEGHEWDAHPGHWVRAQRRGDARRLGWYVAGVVLDTTVLIDALRGRPVAARIRSRRDRDFAARGVTLSQADCRVAAAAWASVRG